ncbi:MAG: 3-hydroxyacyl-CoA dehydrogenase NAD-binding domain-containing protein [Oxalicibacterium faecigallinarum]|uniref:3-hydroxyacyl-CoA dehydrogenase/enoyl-CoA hydratase family protein n=1 Tax=Oxalicibacterium faecigallinarum TaxID=573741 RepID=UPI00280822D8|nr:3-hydroxyacyl-CoA dehydrogenase NAD-binding domain-containing protein [Oxalicibacterium faecigallinarum]MDQ7970651.1 3-hydroxyacyl-CoA dehydrogenase NAD-binding domain-containing protein [Oxalicibacterium faecigallinarum]
MTNFIVKKVAVLGAGVMGAQIAAHCINAKVPVILFDLPAKEGNKNGIVLRAIDNLRKLNPAPLGLPELATQIEIGNYEDDLERLAECDLIIEAIAERMDWKHDLYKQVAPHVAADAIFASNTSGLSITRLSDGLSEELKPRFCGVHFFNPPRYMHLVELIPTAATRPEILDQLEAFLTTTLGKGVVRAFDTPNFIANRVGIFGMLATIIEAEKFGLTVDVVDDLTGSKLGRAKSGTFRTADVVGLDTMSHVIKTMQDNLHDDPFYSVYQTPALVGKLIEGGAFGQKSGAGFYKKVGKDILRIDPATADYVPSGAKADDLIGRILKEKDPAKRMKALHDSSNPQAQFLWAIFRDMFHYIAVHLESIADNAREIDFAMRWGYGWSVGPFEIWQAAGWSQIANWVREDIDAGKALSREPLPAWVFDGRHGVHVEDGSWSPSQRKVIPRSDLSVYARQAFRAGVFGDHSVGGAAAGTTVFEDDAVRIWHQDDDVLVLSFKTKMHVISPAVTAGIHKALEEAEANYKGLVIWHADAAEGGAFSAGADLQSMLPLFMSGGTKAIEPEVVKLQQAHQAIKYANVPVVAAVAGLALGGGCELLLHAARRVAAIESYIGLVEVGVGLIPAGGGLKEITARAAEAAKGNDILQFLKHTYMHAATAAVSRSALEAQSMGYLKGDDVIVFNPYELLHVARSQVHAMHEAGYRAPRRTLIPVIGRYGIATIGAQLINMRDGGFISAHDYKLGMMIAEIVSGGDLDAGSLVDERWLLDRERKAFMELLDHPKTQERIMGMMQSGKPVRN